MLDVIVPEPLVAVANGRLSDFGERDAVLQRLAKANEEAAKQGGAKLEGTNA